MLQIVRDLGRIWDIEKLQPNVQLNRDYLFKKSLFFWGARTMKSPRRKRRSDKFPLTLHPTGQYWKKIKGKIRYFGTDKKKALERYLAQATYLHGCLISTRISFTSDAGKPPASFPRLVFYFTRLKQYNDIDESWTLQKKRHNSG